MNNKGLVGAIVIIILVVIAGVYLAAQDTGPTNNTSNVSNNTPQNVSEQNTTVNNETNSTNSTNNTGVNNTTVVSAQQAKQIARAYILESGASAGDPALITWSDGRLVWNVPVINSNGEKEGVSIYIDAQTGARLG